MSRALTLPATAAALMDDRDPLSLAILPPPDETPAHRAQRQAREAAAKRVSEAIDRDIAKELAVLRERKKRCVKVLLLGQSESGKSTTLKNFQLMYARTAWTAEKDAWRSVIQLNVVRSITTIADAVRAELELAAGRAVEEVDNNPNLKPITERGDSEEDEQEVEARERERERERRRRSLPVTERHRELVTRVVEVLRPVQRELERRLGAGAEEIEFATPAQVQSSAQVMPLRTRRSQQEFFVRSAGWKSAVQRLRPRLSTSSRTGRFGRSGSESRSGGDVYEDDNFDADRVGQTLSRAKDAMRALWDDRVVREVVKVRKTKLGDCAEFYLNDLDRVASASYTPSDDDVIRARLRTIGVQEHRIMLETGPQAGHEWIIYDVGGSRSMRAQWPSYFDDVHSVIFLAPISCFDETLAEDLRVNRLDDSMQLWRLLCQNKLLARTELVLFLNKCDVLRRKLNDGVRFAEYVTSYRGEEEASAVGKYLKVKFSDMFRQYSKTHRGLHVHFTSVVDTKATALTLAAVKDGILRGHLRGLSLI